MKAVNVVLCGLGGQGILFMTKVLAEAALDRGLNLMGAETHGMAQRGGSVVSHLRLGDVKGSLVEKGTAHFLLALEENEAYRNLPFVAGAGGLYVNAPDGRFPRENTRDYLDRKSIRSRSLPAGELAMELGAPMSANLALLGFFSAFNEGPLGYEEIRETIKKVTPERFVQKNLEVFDAGFDRGKQSG